MKITATVEYSIDPKTNSCIATIVFSKLNDNGHFPLRFGPMFDLEVTTAGKGGISFATTLTDDSWETLTEKVNVYLDYVQTTWQASVDLYKRLTVDKPADTTIDIYEDTDETEA